jgi:hypothetical protein
VHPNILGAIALCRELHVLDFNTHKAPQPYPQ